MGVHGKGAGNRFQKEHLPIERMMKKTNNPAMIYASSTDGPAHFSVLAAPIKSPTPMVPRGQSIQYDELPAHAVAPVFLCHKSSCRVCNGSGSTGYCYGYIDCCEYFLKFGQMANGALKNALIV